MTGNELNQKAVEILDGITGLISEFQGLRQEATDDAWDEASYGHTWLDTLCEIEYTLGL